MLAIGVNGCSQLQAGALPNVEINCSTVGEFHAIAEKV